MLGLGIIAPLMPIYAQNLGATGVWLGIIFSSYSLSQFIIMPIIGEISDKTGRKFYIVIGLCAYSIISLLYLVSTNIYSLIVIRLIHGIFSAMVIPISTAYVGETAEKGNEGKTMGTFNIAIFLGIGSGPLFGGLLSDTLGIDSVFCAMSALSAIAFFICLLFLPNIKVMKIKSENKTVSLKQFLKSNVLKGLLLFRAINAVGRGGLIAFLPIYAFSLDLTAFQIGIIVSVNVFLTAILQRRLGVLADKYNKFYLIIIGSVLTSITLMLIPLTTNFILLFLIGSLMGFAGAVSMPAASALNVIVGKKIGGVGAAMGLFNSAMSIGMIVAPLLAGVVMEIFGIKSVFYFSALISICGTAVFYLFVRTEQV
jgi:MFS family permease